MWWLFAAQVDEWIVNPRVPGWNRHTDRPRSVVFPPRPSAFRTPEEPGLALVRGSELPQPPVGGVVAAFLASCTGGRESGVGLTFEYGNRLLGTPFNRYEGFNAFVLLCEPTTHAHHHAVFQRHHAATVRTEFHAAILRGML